MININKISKASFINILALTFIVFTFIFDFTLLFHAFPTLNRDIVIGIANLLNSGGLIMILSFFFGSSKSSQDKDATIKNLTKPDDSEQHEPPVQQLNS